MELRRSARLRGRTPATESSVEPEPAPSKLPSVEEQPKTPKKNSSRKKNTKPSTPCNSSAGEQSAPSPGTKTPVKTPVTTPVKTPPVGDARPAHSEMHPSKVRQSTSRQPDSGLVLGFKPMRRDSNGNIIKETAATDTPSKVNGSPAGSLISPKFDFQFDESQLSEEARKLMESVRGDVARIKAQMILDRNEQKRKEAEAGDSQEQARKIATPRSRFSEAHRKEFAKMPSILTHWSLIRSKVAQSKAVENSLKRKISKADLDDPPAQTSPSKTPTDGAKRVKRSDTDDASATRPRPDESSSPKKSAIPKPKIAARSSTLMTPTKASSARAVSAKPSRTSMIPSLKTSPSRIPTPRPPQSERVKKTVSSTSPLKSILRPHRPLFSTDPEKLAAGTHVAPPTGFNPDIDLSGAPSASFEPPPTPSPKKRVEFSPSTKSCFDIAQETPSPARFTSLPADDNSSDVVYPSLPSIPSEEEDKTAGTPTIRRVRESDSEDKRPQNLPAVLHGLSNKKRLKEGVTARSSIADKPKSPVRAAARSGLFTNTPSTPQGTINKKRRREDDDDSSAKDRENIPPNDEAKRSSKKLKPTVSVSPLKKSTAATPYRTPVKPAPTATPRSTTGTRPAATPSSARKGVLTMSRLNMLATPKYRREKHAA
ncbi:hypothetical protein VTN31DRAFT_5657 [Thermomyces dupontii]|uniref:uncharacterized protein n=1 Tax=Talaromyces thermophilus TaxID=28565 RepID=UPI0037434A71